jgi:hypothetical protein
VEAVMKTYPVYDFVLIAFASCVAAGSLKLGFGRFSNPGAGFMPFLSSILLITLGLADLAAGAASRWKADKTDKELWSDIEWHRMFGALGLLAGYALLLPLLGFCLPTAALLFFLFHLIEQRPAWRTALGAVAITAVFYLGFGYALGAELPRGLLGF